MSNYNVTQTVPFLEWWGFGFALDWDGQLKIEYPETLDPKVIATFLALYPKEIGTVLKNRTMRDRSQCVGGPFNGKRHGHCCGARMAFKVKRGKWAAYKVSMDGRAFFHGLAGSEAKARKLALRNHKVQT